MSHSGTAKTRNPDLLKLYRRLAALRKNNPVIKHGKFEFLKEYCDGEALAFRRYLGGKALVCLMNNSSGPKTLALAKGLLGKTPSAVINHGITLRPAGKALAAELAPGAYAVFKR